MGVACEGTDVSGCGAEVAGAAGAAGGADAAADDVDCMDDVAAPTGLGLG